MGRQLVPAHLSSLVVALDFPGDFLEFRNVLLQPDWSEPDVFRVHNDKSEKYNVGLDGPLFGTEKLLNELRAVQMLIAVLAIFGVFSANRRVHASISLAILFCLGAGAVIRFLPGQNLG